MSVLSTNSTSEKKEELPSYSSNVPEETTNQNETIKRGTKLSRKLYQCIKTFSSCTKNNFGNCPRTYQRCTLKVFDENIDGKQTQVAKEVNTETVQEPIEPITETTTKKVLESTQSSTTTISEASSVDKPPMQAYPDMALFDPTSKSQN